MKSTWPLAYKTEIQKMKKMTLGVPDVQIQTNSSDAWMTLKHIFYFPWSIYCGFSSNRTVCLQECCICLPGCPGPDTSAWRRTEQPTTERWALWRGLRGTQQILIRVLNKDAVKVSLELQHTNRHKCGQIQLVTTKNYITNEMFCYWEPYKLSWF